eukprot:jgi/Bigna1/82389/fgenesh1_pg.91_\
MGDIEKWVYYFQEGNKNLKSLLGGKGANLAEMTNIGLPVPPGFTITTKACIRFTETKAWPGGLKEQIEANISRLEKQLGKKIGDRLDPLLLSVRSGAVISMPGMMDTVLNLGLNAENVEAIERASGNMRWAYDSFRRFIQMFGEVCLGLDHSLFEELLEAIKEETGARQDTDLTAEAMQTLCARYLSLFKSLTGGAFPSDVRAQLRIAVDAVFRSWGNPRARKYRALNEIPDDLGTAVNVQAMVFGNMGDDCATGVGFTRNPSTGENVKFGEYLVNAQGEDVVAGIRTPLHISDMRQTMPRIYKQLMDIFDLLEKHYRNMQDIEFTIQNGKLWILQTRNGKRTARAAVRMATEMVEEGLIDKRTAVLRVSPEQIENLMHDQLDPQALKETAHVAKGLPASPGAAVGQVVFSSEEAARWREEGKRCILLRLETSPEDIGGIEAAEGILTARGGMTSHAAVVARGMNKCCVAGCSELEIKFDGNVAWLGKDGGGGEEEEGEEEKGSDNNSNDDGGFDTKQKGGNCGEEKQKKTSKRGKGKQQLKRGDWLSLDGSTGKVYLGKLPVMRPEIGGSVGTLLEYADEFRSLRVLANADTPKDAALARKLGAEGVGLTRTEHMFFAPERIHIVREMILAFNRREREAALAQLLPLQCGDFKDILESMDGNPVIIRLLDPPLHEFLPHSAREIAELARDLKHDEKQVQARVEAMKEYNPMLGFRGCRLGVVHPEISVMQVRAIFEAAVELAKAGKSPQPRIEIPLVTELKEFSILKELVKKVARDTGAEGLVHYKVGVMIETPRAALTADALAEHAEFMSFGTNDLTQLTCGFSRDDAGSFLGHYVRKLQIYEKDPFQSLDQAGVGRMMMLCVGQVRESKNRKLNIGVCGEHGGDPASVKFCHRIGLDNVSCSPFRVPVARMAAAHAALLHGKGARLTVKLRIEVDAED